MGYLSVVLVEDDNDTLETLQELLTLAGYRAHAFTYSLQMLTQPELIAQATLLVSDYVMDKMNGAELIRAARAIQPGLRGCLSAAGARPRWPRLSMRSPRLRSWLSRPRLRR